MLPEELYEVATEVEGHDLVGGAHQIAPDEDRRERGGAAHPLERLLDLGALGVGVDVVDAGVNLKLLEQNLDCVAQAARALAEDQYPIFWCQFYYLLHFSIFSEIRVSIIRRKCEDGSFA